MSRWIDRALLEVKSFLESNRQYKGAAILCGERLVRIGDIDEKIARSVASAADVLTMVFRGFKASPQRYFVVEGKGYCVSYGKFSFDSSIVLVGMDLPIGAAMYDVRRLSRTLQKLLEGWV